jgi:hypothetical protein
VRKKPQISWVGKDTVGGVNVSEIERECSAVDEALACQAVKNKGVAILKGTELRGETQDTGRDIATVCRDAEYLAVDLGT